MTLVADVPNETDEDLGFDEKEKQERNKLKEIDSMYILNSEDDDEYNIFRGVRKPAGKNANQESFAPLISPYIHNGASATKSEGSPTNSRDSSTVMDATQNDVDNT